MNRQRILSGFIVIILLVLCFGPAFCGEENSKLVIKVSGTVETKNDPSSPWQKVWQSRLVADGGLARTLENSKAKIRLEDQSIIDVGEKTQVEISKVKVTKESRSVDIKLIVGTIRNRVGKFVGKDSEYKVETPNSALAARGTDFYVKYDPQGKAISNLPTGMAGIDTAQSQTGGTSMIYVFSGMVDLTAGGHTMVLTEGNSAVVNPDGSIVLNPDGFQGPPPGEFEEMDWDVEVATDIIPLDPYIPEGVAEPGGHTEPGIITVQPQTDATGNCTVIITY